MRQIQFIFGGKKPNNDGRHIMDNERDGVMNGAYEPLVTKR